eukprot:2868593-Prymnesium_polylepis.1
MFYSRYEEHEPPRDEDKNGQPADDAPAAPPATPPATPLSRTRIAASAELQANAEAFSRLVPAGRFTAAEIMGYMLKHEMQQSALAGAALLAEGGSAGAKALVALPNALRMGGRSGEGVGAHEP